MQTKAVANYVTISHVINGINSVPCLKVVSLSRWWVYRAVWAQYTHQATHDKTWEAQTGATPHHCSGHLKDARCNTKFTLIHCLWDTSKSLGKALWDSRGVWDWPETGPKRMGRELKIFDFMLMRVKQWNWWGGLVVDWEAVVRGPWRKK